VGVSYTEAIIRLLGALAAFVVAVWLALAAVFGADWLAATPTLVALGSAGGLLAIAHGVAAPVGRRFAAAVAAADIPDDEPSDAAS
jgi:hypothetical protein